MEPKKCTHEDNFAVAGNSIFMSDDGSMLIVTTMFCKHCGAIMTSAANAEPPAAATKVGGIALPGKMPGKQ